MDSDNARHADSDNRDIGMLINMLSRKTRKRIDATLAELGVTGVQGRIMRFIEQRAEEGAAVYQKDIENAFELSRSTVTNILNNMEKNSLIRRASVCIDGRLKRVELTDRAGDIHERIKGTVGDIEKRLKQNISEGQLMVFLETLEIMLKNLD